MMMALGLNTEAFLDWPLSRILDWVVTTAPQITAIEVVAGGYCGTGHCDTERLLHRKQERDAWRDEFSRRDLQLVALNVSGNPLHPNPEIAEKHDGWLRRAIQLAPELGVDRLVAMSGCPGAAESDRAAPHFCANTWLPDYGGIVDWQWEERVLPYWQDISELAAREHPALRICLELHPGAAAYNTATFARLAAAGSNLAANLDPSHFFWQSMDPLAIVARLGDRIGHAHAKDTILIPENLALNGLLDNRWPGDPAEMPWNFATVGHGHDRAWWLAFVQALVAAGFEGTLAIEHEDPLVPAEEGIVEAVQLLSDVMRSVGG